MQEHKVDQTDGRSISASNRLCATLVAEAFEHLGCSLRSATAGQPFTRISHHPKHTQLVDRIYEFLENDFRLIDTQEDGSQLIRTTHAIGAKSSESVVQELIDSQDPWTHAHRLAYHAGKRLPSVLKGTEDGIAALFGSVESRGLVEGLYYNLPFNRLFYEQMRDMIDLLIESLPYDSSEPLRILEVGAGTCGTTEVLALYLAEQRIPAELKSAQSLRLFPDLKGSLCWTPVDVVAGTVIELALNNSALHSVYHIDNPIRQPWGEMVPVLAEALNIPRPNIKPFAEWLRRVKCWCF